MQPRQPFADELEIGADGYIRDTKTGEIYGRIPVPLRDLYAAAPDLLAACEEVMEFLSNGTPVNPGALVQASVFNAIRLAKGGPR